jgi:hypothetical protein
MLVHLEIQTEGKYITSFDILATFLLAAKVLQVNTGIQLNLH